MPITVPLHILYCLPKHFYARYGRESFLPLIGRDKPPSSTAEEISYDRLSQSSIPFLYVIFNGERALFLNQYLLSRSCTYVLGVPMDQVQMDTMW